MVDTLEALEILASEERQATLKRYCLSLTGNQWDAEDLEQETWVKSLTLLNKSAHRNPEALMLRIAKTTWIDGRRRYAAYNRILKHQLQNDTFADEGEYAFGTELIMQSLYTHLSPLQRTVFLLRDVMDYSIKESAAWLRTTEGAVKAALLRARKGLEAVRRELAEGKTMQPEDDALRDYIQAMAMAHRAYDVRLLVALSNGDAAELAGMLQLVQRQPQVGKISRIPKAQYMPSEMAA